MKESRRTFGDKLVAIETPNPEFRLKYERQVRAMLENKLSPVKRIGFALLALVGLLAAARYFTAMFPSHRPWEVEWITYFFMVPAFLVAVAWTGLTSWAAVAGSSPRSQRPWLVAAGLAMAFFYLITLMFMFVLPLSHEESRTMLGTQLALMAFFMLNTAGLCIILGVLYRARFDNQEKLLKIEYHLADLSEQIGRLSPKGTKD
jgi:hypothetical protein